MLRHIFDSLCLLSRLNISSLKKTQNIPTLPLLPSKSFFSTLQLDFDYAPNTEASTFQTVVTGNILEIFFEVGCTRVTIKTQTTSLTLPKDLWRTLEAARQLDIITSTEPKKKSITHCFLSKLIFKLLKEFEKNKVFIRCLTAKVLCSRNLVR